MNRIDCKTFILELLCDYVEETLAPTLNIAIERHLANCEACRAYLATYRRTRETAGAVMTAPMPDEMKVRLRRIILERLSADES